MTDRRQSTLPPALRKLIGISLLLGTVGLATCQAYRQPGVAPDDDTVRGAAEIVRPAWIRAHRSPSPSRTDVG